MIDYSGSLVNVITAHAFLETMAAEGHTGVIVTVGASATGLAIAALAREKQISVLFLVRSEHAREQLLESTWDAPEMAVVTRVIDLMLKQHEPHPAIVMDRYWNVLKTNDASPRFSGSFVNLSKRPEPRNLLDLMFDPDGMRPFIENWDEVASGLLQRVYRETIGHTSPIPE